MKVFLGGVVTKASGRFVNMVFQAWRGLSVVREFEAPTQPNSPRQLSVRAIFSEISKYWANTLTEGLRQAWANFVFRWTDLWGNEVSLTGLNLFQKFNFVLQDNARPFQTTPPPLISPVVLLNTYENIADGVVVIGASFSTATAVTSQQSFLDVWGAVGNIHNISVINEDDTSLELEIQADGLPQGVNPVKSDYKHIAYIDYKAQGAGADPTKTKIIYISVRPLGGGLWQDKKRVSIITRNYNKFGNYSSPDKLSVVTVPA